MLEKDTLDLLLLNPQPKSSQGAKHSFSLGDTCFVHRALIKSLPSSDSALTSQLQMTLNFAMNGLSKPRLHSFTFHETFGESGWF